MIREKVIPRNNFQQKLENIGLSFHSWDDYWKEDVCYKFSSNQIDLIEEVTENLHKMCLNAVDYIISKKKFSDLAIPEIYWNEIEKSFKNGDMSLYGRFDLVYDGVNPPKMLEYNADTPTSLLESAVAQWYWMEDVYPQHDQFNSIHDNLVERWKMLPEDAYIHVASIKGNEEDWVCTMYIVDTIIQSGRSARHINVEDIGYCSTNNCFVDLDNNTIEYLFKLYPWEWMMREEFGKFVINSNTKFIEPIWKSVLSCKGILPILWELYPNHENLLPSYFNYDKLSSLNKGYAKKPLYSREGANVELYSNNNLISSDSGPYGKEGFVYQQLYLPPEIDNRYPIIGSWIVGDKPSGICVREDNSKITTNMSNFVPHYFCHDY